MTDLSPGSDEALLRHYLQSGDELTGVVRDQARAAFDRLTQRMAEAPLGKNRRGEEIGIRDITEAITLIDLAERASGHHLSPGDRARLTSMLTIEGPDRLRLFTSLQALGSMISGPR